MKNILNEESEQKTVYEELKKNKLFNEIDSMLTLFKLMNIPILMFKYKDFIYITYKIQNFVIELVLYEEPIIFWMKNRRISKCKHKNPIKIFTDIILTRN